MRGGVRPDVGGTLMRTGIKEVDLNRIAVSNWLNFYELCKYVGFAPTVMRPIAKQIGGRLLPGVSGKLVFYKPDVDAFILKLPKLA